MENTKHIPTLFHMIFCSHLPPIGSNSLTVWLIEHFYPQKSKIQLRKRTGVGDKLFLIKNEWPGKISSQSDIGSNINSGQLKKQ